MLTRVKLPPTVHHHAHFLVRQRKGYDMNIWTPKKRDEKLNYMHNNPVKLRLGESARRLAVVKLEVLFSG